ncbi:hypothetical protein NDU88_007190 [Pleurodeles waltl]|uniref:Uncharacterized protein n=1 Tax=Pleurodeles waltl TaxID=8319 RepID=A0AAV7NVI9_PLEWA|nr:hypothetical protein NDU88_007190 [Pleurodeles waltl]
MATESTALPTASGKEIRRNDVQLLTQSGIRKRNTVRATKNQGGRKRYSLGFRLKGCSAASKQISAAEHKLNRATSDRMFEVELCFHLGWVCFKTTNLAEIVNGSRAKL